MADILRPHRPRLRARAAMSPRSARRSSASRPRSSSARCSAASASTGAASRPRRCCARPRSSTICSTPTLTGSSASKAGFDLDKVVARSRGGRQAAQPGRHAPDEEEQDRRAHGRRASSPRKGKLTVTGADGKATELAAKHIIVATGARARDLPFAKADGKRIWTYRHAMTPPEMPTELLVIGSGAIGIEFASFYNDLGAKVTVVEMLDRIVPVEDAEVSALPRKAAHQAGHDDPHRRPASRASRPTPRASRRRSRPRTASRPSIASAMPSSRSASPPTPRISGSKRSA